MTDRYAKFDKLLFDRPAPHVLRIKISNPGKQNAITAEMHRQLEDIWPAIDEDPEIRVSIITGDGRSFSAGGALQDMPIGSERDTLDQFSIDFGTASRLVQRIINTKKPIVSAINGAAVGAGLAIALLADVPIAAKSAKLFDGHLRAGIVPGDHAALIWPLLCGMAKAKYFLMTNTPMTGEEAAANNLVALAVDSDLLEAKSIEVAAQLAAVAPTALRMTKYVMNHWLRQAQPIFDLSAALEIVGLLGGEAKEAVSALMEKRVPQFTRPSQF